MKRRRENSSLLTPVTLLTGFLGSGKTTLLNRILSADHGLRVAVLVNDFGAINIDAKLVVGVEGETVSLANGCICCTIRDDLLSETLRLLSRRDRPDYIVIEASGVSDPKLIAQTFLDSELCGSARVDGIVTVVDAEQILDLRDDKLELALEQITVADIVVLNKADLVSSEQFDAVGSRIAELVPGARLLPAVYARVPLELLLGIGSFEPGRILDNDTSAIHVHQPGDDVCDHAGCDHRAAGHADHDTVFSTWHWSGDEPLSLAAFRSLVEALPSSIYRAKGIIQLREYPRYSVEFQLTGRRSSLSATGLWGDTPPRSEIVMIGSGCDVQFEAMQDSLNACAQDQNDELPLLDWRKNPRIN